MENSDIEHRIIEAAKEAFVENGYAETSMSDIAVRAGVNRPTLHYYFRTKERLYQAVFGSIAERLAPQVQDIVRRRDISPGQRAELVVDAYYEIFLQHPTLPLFIMREAKRDFDFLAEFVHTLRFDEYFENIRREIQTQMDEGLVKSVPMRMLFLTFYSLLTMPFAIKPVCEKVMLNDNERFPDMLITWKHHVGNIVESLLAK